jgi:2'-5' RNA ligase
VRLFAAIEIPAAERERIAVSIGGLRSLPLRLTPEEQWHITVAFFGEVAEDVVPDLTERLRRGAARTSPLHLQLVKAGTFPANPKRAKVLWIGVGGDTEQLGRLADRCVAAGRRSGIAMEDRRFRPHLTIGRARGQFADLDKPLGALWSYEGQPWEATRVTLIHSTVGATVHHRPLAEFPLEH